MCCHGCSPRIVSESLGQSVVVENLPGATGTVAMASVASAPADGYTLMFTGSSFATVALLMRNLPFSMDAFTPLSRLTIGPTILTVPSQLGVKSVAEFVAAGRPSRANGLTVAQASARPCILGANSSR